jgi:hypothetical protein
MSSLPAISTHPVVIATIPTVGVILAFRLQRLTIGKAKLWFR